MKFFTLLSLFLFSLSASVDPFPEVAERAIPAIVTIRVEAGAQDMEDYDLSESLGDDLLRRFFGYGLSPFGMHKHELPRGQGSGVLVSSNGVILTNNHVVNGYKLITIITNDGEEYEGKVLGADPQSDLAVVKIEAENTPYLSLGDSSKLKIAEAVIAAGNPFGLKATITKGIISATGRSNLDIALLEDFIQTDAAINRGNSGGPLLNANGEIIGINTAIATNSTGSYMGIGLAIPSNIAKEVLEQVLATGKVQRGFLGVKLQPMTDDLAHAFGLKRPQGAILAEITAGSAAEKAGLQRGDIVLSMNGKPIDSESSLRTHVAMMAPGSKIDLGIKRGKDLLTLPVVLETRPDAEKTVLEPPIVSKLGLAVEALTPDVAKSLGHGNEQGVVVTKVDPKGAVARVGLKKGALILSVNRNAVTNPDEFLAAIEKSDENDGVLLQVKQEGAVRFVYLRGF